MIIKLNRENKEYKDDYDDRNQTLKDNNDG